MRSPRKAGLLHWAERAVAEAEKASPDLQPDPVHDLRVAIRRCRSMAEALRSVDPLPLWKEFRRSAKPLFSALGELRDTQVMKEWVCRLSPANDSLRAALLLVLDTREIEQKNQARTALAAFDRDRWHKLAKKLNARSRRHPPGSLIFQHLALERWRVARRLHAAAMRRTNAVALHQLRIGIKRFRYTVENFLPELHREWSSDLKRMQDVLGEIHDLDVLSAQVSATAADEPLRSSWQNRISKEYATRLSEYRARMTGPASLWKQWRAALPAGPQLVRAASAHVRAWSAALDPDRAHSRRVLSFSLQLLREINRATDWNLDGRSAELLRAAAFLHDVGGASKKKYQHKETARLLRKLPLPAGWTRQKLEAVRLIATCCHSGDRGATAMYARFRQLPPPRRRELMTLAGIFRLADAFDGISHNKVGRIRAASSQGVLAISAEGYRADSTLAETIAAARHLLETARGIPIIVRPLRKQRT